jgi:predicted 3-demethylubiquinone-9 3-methyltransferase (glyoxalase superfamily)
MLQKITPSLWFESQAEEAARFYCEVFDNSRILEIARMPVEAPGAEGPVLTVRFELEGLEFTALNGGPEFQFTEAVSFQVSCSDQAEVDRYWNALTADGGEESQCAWLKDRFGLSWQIIPTALPRLLGSRDPERAASVMRAMLKMRKIVVADLEAAYENPTAA